MAREVKASADDLLKMKKEVQLKEDKIKVLEGKEAANLERMEKEFAVSTIPEAEKKIQKLADELSKRDLAFLAKLGELKGKYPWDCFA